MIVINPTSDQVLFANEFLKIDSMAHRGKFDGDKHQQLFGLIAQVIVMDYLKLDRPKNEGFDGGFDLELNKKRYDVKCEMRTVNFQGTFVHNLSAFQINYKADGYIFVSYNKSNGEYSICGVISKEDLKNKSVFYKKGDPRQRRDGTVMFAQCDYYELQNKYLIPLEKFINIK